MYTLRFFVDRLKHDTRMSVIYDGDTVIDGKLLLDITWVEIKSYIDCQVNCYTVMGDTIVFAIGVHGYRQRRSI